MMMMMIITLHNIYKHLHCARAETYI